MKSRDEEVHSHVQKCGVELVCPFVGTTMGNLPQAGEFNLNKFLIILQAKCPRSRCW
jgi:hypothetical protein